MHLLTSQELNISNIIFVPLFLIGLKGLDASNITHMMECPTQKTHMLQCQTKENHKEWILNVYTFSNKRSESWKQAKLQCFAPT